MAVLERRKKKGGGGRGGDEDKQVITEVTDVLGSVCKGQVINGVVTSGNAGNSAPFEMSNAK